MRNGRDHFRVSCERHLTRLDMRSNEATQNAAGEIPSTRIQEVLWLVEVLLVV